MHAFTLIFALASAPALVVCLLTLLGVPWLLFTEFSYFGTGIHRAVYAFFARGYERKWRQREYASPTLTRRLFIEPLQKVLDRGAEGRLLDLACGTGRISLLALKQPWFQGTIEAVDISPQMLARFREALEAQSPRASERVQILQANLGQWQPAAAYDAVALMEASEFLTDLPRLIEQVSRGMRPGGLFLLTIVPFWMTWMFPGRYQSRRSMTRLLKRHGFEHLEFIRWMPRYRLVRAWKSSDQPA